MMRPPIVPVASGATSTDGVDHAGPWPASDMHDDGSGDGTSAADELLEWTINSLFAVGLDLAAASTIIDGHAHERVSSAVTELDRIIASLRRTYYAPGGEINESGRGKGSP